MIYIMTMTTSYHRNLLAVADGLHPVFILNVIAKFDHSLFYLSFKSAI